MKEESFLRQIIKEICQEENIEFNLLSYNWIIQLKKDNKIRYIVNNTFDLNPDSSAEIARDKYATYEVLKYQNIPIIEHKMIFNPLQRRQYVFEDEDWKEVVEYFKKNNDVLVIKPNNGWQGRGVTLCKTINEVKNTIKALFEMFPSLSLCPYYNIKTEYRTFYLDGECLLVYGKKKPKVVGDGSSNIKKLLEKIDLPFNSITKDDLEKLDLEYIPKKDEKIEVSWKHNLSGGAEPEILEDSNLKEKIEDLSIRTGKAMNLNFATIDVILTKDNELIILEVNSGICMTIFSDKIKNGKIISKEIYRKAIKKMFK